MLGKRELYEISGHWSHYRDGMYPPMDLGGEQVVLRPSLCPHHALLYRSRGRSYRELPLRLAEFDLHYTGADGSRHRPVMVHRSIVGSMERAVAHLIERHGGAFPDWLAPEQLVVLPVSDAQAAAAASVCGHAAGLGLRARAAGPDSGTLNRRIRSARLIPYQAVIGEREAGAGQVAVRLRDGRRLPPLPAAAALAGIAVHVAAPRTGLWDAA